MSRTSANNTVRIIGGNWRGRKVYFANRPNLRPTVDRVRETLFNWLAADISGARCLEPFAGSGVLSLEALSRGASEVTLIENDRQVINALRQAGRDLSVPATQLHIVQEDAHQWLRRGSGRFDIVFLDPPFADGLQTSIDLLATAGLLADDALVYFESGTDLETLDLPPGWSLHRNRRAGAVHYGLCLTGGG